jgi:hypothetical protein
MTPEPQLLRMMAWWGDEIVEIDSTRVPDDPSMVFVQTVRAEVLAVPLIGLRGAEVLRA